MVCTVWLLRLALLAEPGLAGRGNSHSLNIRIELIIRWLRSWQHRVLAASMSATSRRRAIEWRPRVCEDCNSVRCVEKEIEDDPYHGCDLDGSPGRNIVGIRRPQADACLDPNGPGCKTVDKGKGKVGR
jgi:hypothetical protein